MLLTQRQRNFSLFAIIAASFSIGVAFGVGYPLTTLVLESWGEPKWVIGLAGAAPAVGILIAMPAVAHIFSRFGAINAMVFGAIFAGTSFLALAAVNDAATWILVRVIMSMCLAAPWLGGETWINRVAHDEIRGRVIALYTVAFFGGFTIGPIILSTFGTTGLDVFFVGALATALAALPIMAVREFVPALSNEEHSGSAIAAFALVPAAMVAAFMSGFSETSYLSLIASVGLAAGLDEQTAVRLLSIMTMGGIILQFPLGWIADKTSRTGVALGLAAGFTVLSVLLPFALRDGLWAAVLVFMLGGVILGFYSVGLAMLGEGVSREQLTAGNAAFIVLYQIGSITGPVASGAAMTHEPITGFVVTVVVLMVASSAAIWFFRDRKQG